MNYSEKNYPDKVLTTPEEHRRSWTAAEFFWVWHPRTGLQTIEVIAFYALRHYFRTLVPAVAVTAVWDRGSVDAIVGGQPAQLKALTVSTTAAGAPSFFVPLDKQGGAASARWTYHYVTYLIDSVPVAMFSVTADRVVDLRDELDQETVPVVPPRGMAATLGFPSEAAHRDVTQKIIIDESAGDRSYVLDAS